MGKGGKGDWPLRTGMAQEKRGGKGGGAEKEKWEVVMLLVAAAGGIFCKDPPPHQGQASRCLNTNNFQPGSLL